MMTAGAGRACLEILRVPQIRLAGGQGNGCNLVVKDLHGLVRGHGG